MKVPKLCVVTVFFSRNLVRMLFLPTHFSTPIRGDCMEVGLTYGLQIALYFEDFCPDRIVKVKSLILRYFPYSVHVAIPY